MPYRERQGQCRERHGCRTRRGPGPGLLRRPMRELPRPGARSTSRASARANLIRPLAKLGMTGTGNCGDCHSGTHHPFVEEWKASRHANVSASRASNASCAGCHEGREALVTVGRRCELRRESQRRRTISRATLRRLPRSARLRQSEPAPLPGHVHGPRRESLHEVPQPAQRTGDSDELAARSAGRGAAGIRRLAAPGFRIRHRTDLSGRTRRRKNPKLCAGCHIAQVHRDRRGDRRVHLPGDGPPDAADSVSRRRGQADGRQDLRLHGDRQVVADLRDIGVSRERGGGCRRVHDRPRPDEVLRRSALGRLERQRQPAGIPDRCWSARTREGTRGQPNGATPTSSITPAEGAEFNARLCGEYGQSNADNSKGIHNPFLCEALLIATINYIRSYYGLPAAFNRRAGPHERSDRRRVQSLDARLSCAPGR